jgi:hypothetical protein
MAGEECPAGAATFQNMFEFSPKWIGGLASGAASERPSGPRNCGHVCISAKAATHGTTRIKHAAIPFKNRRGLCMNVRLEHEIISASKMRNAANSSFLANAVYL